LLDLNPLHFENEYSVQRLMKIVELDNVVVQLNPQAIKIGNTVHEVGNEKGTSTQ
jgi:hypothetical protein